METIILTGLSELTVKTIYDNGVQSEHTVIDITTIDATNKALRLDEKNLGAKVAKCKRAIHEVTCNGKKINPDIETLFNHS